MIWTVQNNFGPIEEQDIKDDKQCLSKSARIGNFERQLWIFPLLKKSCILSTSFVFDQDLEKSGGRLMLAPSLELPEIASSGLTSAWIEGPNSIPKPVVDARIFPERKSYLYIICFYDWNSSIVPLPSVFASKKKNNIHIKERQLRHHSNSNPATSIN